MNCQFQMFAKHFYVIFLANQMHVAIGLAHYDSKAFKCTPVSTNVNFTK